MKRRLNLSASKVDTFFGCKRLFKYRYLKPPPIKFVENKYFLIGNTVHKALELFHTGVGNLSESDWRTHMKKCFLSATDKYNVISKRKKGVITRDEAYGMRDMLKAYLTFLKEEGKLPDSLFIEKMFGFVIAKNPVAGKADRVDKINGGYKVVDYKTGQPASKKDALTSVQLPTYALWITKEVDQGAKVYGEYIYLKYLGTKRGTQLFEITEEMMANAVEKYTRVASYLKNEVRYPRNTSYKYCRRVCDYYDWCMEDDNNVI